MTWLLDMVTKKTHLGSPGYTVSEDRTPNDLESLSQADFINLPWGVVVSVSLILED